MPRRGFIDRAIRHVLAAESHALGAEQDASRPGLLQRLDPRFKVLSAALLVVASASSHSATAVGITFVIVTVVGVISSLKITSIALRVWLPVLLFTTVIATPALFTTPGREVATMPLAGWTITEQGLRTAALLLSRVMTAATIAYVLVVSTTWPRLLAALRGLRIPAPVVVLIGMTYRYVFLLASAAHDMLQSRRSRSVGRLSGGLERAITTTMAGSLMLRSLQLGGDVHLAMQSRGFRGSFDSLETFNARLRDVLALAFAITLSALVIWSGR